MVSNHAKRFKLTFIQSGVWSIFILKFLSHSVLILTHNLVVVWIHSGGQATAFSLRARGIEQTESCCLASDWGTIQINPFLELPRIKNILRYEEILHWSPSLYWFFVNPPTPIPHLKSRLFPQNIKAFHP